MELVDKREKARERGVNGGDGGGVSIYPLICKKKPPSPPPPRTVAIRGQGNRHRTCERPRGPAPDEELCGVRLLCEREKRKSVFVRYTLKRIHLILHKVREGAQAVTQLVSNANQQKNKSPFLNRCSLPHSTSFQQQRYLFNVHVFNDFSIAGCSSWYFLKEDT